MRVKGRVVSVQNNSMDFEIRNLTQKGLCPRSKVRI